MTSSVHIDKARAHKARHFVFRNGVWLGYASKWKSRFVEHPCIAAVYASGPSLGAIQIHMRRLQESAR